MQAAGIECASAFMRHIPEARKESQKFERSNMRNTMWRRLWLWFNSFWLWSFPPLLSSTSRSIQMELIWFLVALYACVCVLVYRHIHCRLAYKLYSCIYVYAFNIDLVFELLLFIDIIVVVVFLLLFITIRTEIKPIQVMRRFYSFNPMSRSFSLSPNMATKWIRKFSLFHTFFDCYSFDPSKIVNLLDVLWPKS